MAPERASFQLSELFDFLDDAVVWVKDREGRYCWVNRAFLLDYSLQHPGSAEPVGAEAILGRTDYYFSPVFLADQFRLDDEQVLAGNRIVNRIERAGQSAGAADWNVTSKIPVCDSRGKIIGTAGITRPLGKTAQGIAVASGFGPVLAYLRDHYTTAVSNQELARLAHMSVRAFERKFHAAFHLTPQKYLRKLRLGIASRALVHTDQSLVSVGLSCGFADQSHFTREFRRHFGRTPRGYREHYTRQPAAVSGTNTAAAGQ